MKLETRFCKKGILRYLSHLDIVRLFQRAVRRADVPVKLSQGYTPHYKISFDNALKLGIESEGERAMFELHRWISPEEFKQRINEKLPEGINIVEISVVGTNTTNFYPPSPRCFRSWLRRTGRIPTNS